MVIDLIVWVGYVLVTIAGVLFCMAWAYAMDSLHKECTIGQGSPVKTGIPDDVQEQVGDCRE